MKQSIKNKILSKFFKNFNVFVKTTLKQRVTHVVFFGFGNFRSFFLLLAKNNNFKLFFALIVYYWGALVPLLGYFELFVIPKNDTTIYAVSKLLSIEEKGFLFYNLIFYYYFIFFFVYIFSFFLIVKLIGLPKFFKESFLLGPMGIFLIVGLIWFALFLDYFSTSPNFNDIRGRWSYAVFEGYYYPKRFFRWSFDNREMYLFRYNLKTNFFLDADSCELVGCPELTYIRGPSWLRQFLSSYFVNGDIIDDGLVEFRYHVPIMENLTKIYKPVLKFPFSTCANDLAVLIGEPNDCKGRLLHILQLDNLLRSIRLPKVVTFENVNFIKRSPISELRVYEALFESEFWDFKTSKIDFDYLKKLSKFDRLFVVLSDRCELKQDTVLIHKRFADIQRYLSFLDSPGSDVRYWANRLYGASFKMHKEPNCISGILARLSFMLSLKLMGISKLHSTWMSDDSLELPIKAWWLIHSIEFVKTHAHHDAYMICKLEWQYTYHVRAILGLEGVIPSWYVPEYFQYFVRDYVFFVYNGYSAKISSESVLESLLSYDAEIYNNHCLKNNAYLFSETNISWGDFLKIILKEKVSLIKDDLLSKIQENALRNCNKSIYEELGQVSPFKVFLDSSLESKRKLYNQWILLLTFEDSFINNKKPLINYFNHHILNFEEFKSAFVEININFKNWLSYCELSNVIQEMYLTNTLFNSINTLDNLSLKLSYLDVFVTHLLPAGPFKDLVYQKYTSLFNNQDVLLSVLPRPSLFNLNMSLAILNRLDQFDLQIGLNFYNRLLNDLTQVEEKLLKLDNYSTELNHLNESNLSNFLSSIFTKVITIGNVPYDGSSYKSEPSFFGNFCTEIKKKFNNFFFYNVVYNFETDTFTLQLCFGFFQIEISPDSKSLFSKIFHDLFFYISQFLKKLIKFIYYSNLASEPCFIDDFLVDYDDPNSLIKKYENLRICYETKLEEFQIYSNQQRLRSLKNTLLSSEEVQNIEIYFNQLDEKLGFYKNVIHLLEERVSKQRSEYCYEFLSAFDVDDVDDIDPISTELVNEPEINKVFVNNRTATIQIISDEQNFVGVKTMNPELIVHQSYDIANYNYWYNWHSLEDRINGLDLVNQLFEEEYHRVAKKVGKQASLNNKADDVFSLERCLTSRQRVFYEFFLRNCTNTFENRARIFFPDAPNMPRIWYSKSISEGLVNPLIKVIGLSRSCISFLENVQLSPIFVNQNTTMDIDKFISFLNKNQIDFATVESSNYFNTITKVKQSILNYMFSSTQTVNNFIVPFELYSFNKLNFFEFLVFQKKEVFFELRNQLALLREEISMGELVGSDNNSFPLKNHNYQKHLWLDLYKNIWDNVNSNIYNELFQYFWERIIRQTPEQYCSVKTLSEEAFNTVYLNVHPALIWRIVQDAHIESLLSSLENDPLFNDYTDSIIYDNSIKGRANKMALRSILLQEKIVRLLEAYTRETFFCHYQEYSSFFSSDKEFLFNTEEKRKRFECIFQAIDNELLSILLERPELKETLLTKIQEIAYGYPQKQLTVNQLEFIEHPVMQYFINKFCIAEKERLVRAHSKMYLDPNFVYQDLKQSIECLIQLHSNINSNITDFTLSLDLLFYKRLSRDLFEFVSFKRMETFNTENIFERFKTQCDFEYKLKTSNLLTQNAIKFNSESSSIHKGILREQIGFTKNSGTVYNGGFDGLEYRTRFSRGRKLAHAINKMQELDGSEEVNSVDANSFASGSLSVSSTSRSPVIGGLNDINDEFCLNRFNRATGRNQTGLSLFSGIGIELPKTISTIENEGNNFQYQPTPVTLSKFQTILLEFNQPFYKRVDTFTTAFDLMGIQDASLQVNASNAEAIINEIFEGDFPFSNRISQEQFGNLVSNWDELQSEISFLFKLDSYKNINQRSWFNSMINRIFTESSITKMDYLNCVKPFLESSDFEQKLSIEEFNKINTFIFEFKKRIRWDIYHHTNMLSDLMLPYTRPVHLIAKISPFWYLQDYLTFYKFLEERGETHLVTAVREFITPRPLVLYKLSESMALLGNFNHSEFMPVLQVSQLFFDYCKEFPKNDILNRLESIFGHRNLTEELVVELCSTQYHEWTSTHEQVLLEFNTFVKPFFENQIEITSVKDLESYLHCVNYIKNRLIDLAKYKKSNLFFFNKVTNKIIYATGQRSLSEIPTSIITDTCLLAGISEQTDLKIIASCLNGTRYAHNYSELKLINDFLVKLENEIYTRYDPSFNVLFQNQMEKVFGCNSFSVIPKEFAMRAINELDVSPVVKEKFLVPLTTKGRIAEVLNPEFVNEVGFQAYNNALNLFCGKLNIILSKEHTGWKLIEPQSRLKV